MRVLLSATLRLLVSSCARRFQLTFCPSSFRRSLRACGLTANSQGFVPLLALSFWAAKTDDRQNAELYQRADYLYDQYQIESLVKFLRDRVNHEDVEFVWRYARAVCELGKISSDNKRKEMLFNEALDIIDKGKSLPEADKSSQFHKWYAIILNYTSGLKGTKEQLVKSFEVKEHFLKAVENNPLDATSLHLLGVWCFTFADLPWYQRKVASAVFTAPPESSYDEALMYFEKAEATDPNFYSQNLLMLGKTYLRLGNKEKAKELFQKTIHYAVSTQDDIDAHDEAEKLLRSLK